MTEDEVEAAIFVDARRVQGAISGLVVEDLATSTTSGRDRLAIGSPVVNAVDTAALELVWDGWFYLFLYIGLPITY